MGKDGSAGAKSGLGIAKVIAEHVHDARMRLLPHHVTAAVDAANAFLDQVGEEGKATMGSLFAQLAEDPGATGWVKDTLGFMAHGHGQLQALLSSNVIGSAVMSGIGRLVDNALAPACEQIIMVMPNAILDAATAASAVARNLLDYNSGKVDASKGGVNQTRFDVLVDMAKQSPGPDELADALRRGYISEGQAERGMLDSGLREEWHDLKRLMAIQLLTPPQLAEMVVKGIIPQADAAVTASYSGMREFDFDLAVADAGNSLDPTQLGEALRRGFIDEATFAHGIKTGLTRDEWIPTLLALRHSPMSTADAVAAVVQGHLDDAQGRAIAEQNGLEPQHWTPLVETHGRPPGTQEMIQLWRRGAVTQAEVESAIRESDVKDKYIPAILQTRTHVLPERSVVSLLAKGAISDDDARRMFGEIGLEPIVIAALVAEGHSHKTATVREMSLAEIRTLYADHALTAADAKARIVHHGYTAADADLIIELGDLERGRKETASILNRVRALYVARHIDDHQALGEMGTLDVPVSQRDHLLRLWGLERATTVARLTEPQIIAAAKHQVITVADALARLTARGYSRGDADVLLRTSGLIK